MYKERKELDEAAEVIKIDDIYSLPSDIIVDMSPATKDGLSINKDMKKIRNRIVSIPQEAAPIGILTAYEQVFMITSAGQ